MFGLLIAAFTGLVQLAINIAKTYKYVYTNVWKAIKHLFRFIPITLIVNLLLLITLITVLVFAKDQSSAVEEFSVNSGLIDVQTGYSAMSQVSNITQQLGTLCYSDNVLDNVIAIVSIAILVMIVLYFLSICIDVLLMVFFWKVFIATLIIDAILAVARQIHRKIKTPQVVDNN